MRRAGTIVAPGGWPAGSEAGHVLLTFDDRYRRRLRLSAGAAGDILLDLPQARVLGDGAALLLDDGTLIAIAAADEPLIEARAASPALLLRLAWHIGNRHLPARLDEDRILLRRDHVIAAMLEGLGATVTEVVAPFDPEGGAYSESGTHGDAGDDAHDRRPGRADAHSHDAHSHDGHSHDGHRHD